MSRTRGQVLIAGISVRAMVQSAARAGYAVTAIDAYGDLDTTRAAERVLTPRRDLGRSFSPSRLATLAELTDAELLAFGSNLENHPQVLGRLMEGRVLLGNSPDVLRLARNPIHLARTLQRSGLAGPAVRGAAPVDAGSWLLKPRRSGGGRGITRWTGGARVSRRCYLQERIRGIPASIAFSSDSRRVIPLAVSRQLIGIRALGARDFMYSGSILAPVGDSQFPNAKSLFDRARAVAEVVAQGCGLRGINGIDFMARDGVPFPIEVNPRYSASMELAERAWGVSVFQMHVAGCLDRLTTLESIPQRFPAVGKAIVYARREITLGDTRFWQEDPSLADIPAPGEHIATGHPICTIFATAANGLECERNLLRRAERLYAELPGARGRAA